jgi:hypothetical protein
MLFAGMALDSEYTRQTSKPIDIKDISFSLDEEEIGKQSNTARLIDFLEMQKENIELTKTECALIEVSTSPQGTQSFDLPSSLKKQSGRNKARKDSYSALVLGNWMMNIYYDMINLKVDDYGDTFVPMLIK